jgi:chaperone modulatory protein CbpM
MITLEMILLEFRALDRAELERWVAAALIRAEGAPEAWRFTEIDVARIRLIVELRHELEVEERTLPIVLSLMDQLYDLRRRTARLNDALAEVPADLRLKLLGRLT